MEIQPLVAGHHPKDGRVLDAPRVADRRTIGDHSPLANDARPMVPPRRDQQEVGSVEVAGRVVPARPARSADAPETPKKWTVLLYLNGNNRMQAQAMSTLRLAEFFGSTKDVDIVATVSRKRKWYDFLTGDWSGARRYYVTQNPNPISPLTMLSELLHWYLPPFTGGITSRLDQILGPLDMGKGETLKREILAAMRDHPSQRLMVLMKMPSKGTAGFSKDASTGSEMTPADLARALKEVEAESGKKVDILALEGSGTASLEMAYQLKDGARYLVGSQEALAGIGFPLPAMLNEVLRLNDDDSTAEAAPPLQLAQLMGLIGAAASAITPLFTPAISAADLSKVSPLAEAVDRLARTLQDAKVPPEHLRLLVKNTQGFGGGSEYQIHRAFRDLGHFAELLTQDPEIASAEVKDAAKAVVERAREVVVADGQLPTDNPNLPPGIPQTPNQPDKPDYSNVTGLSINLDPRYGFAGPERLSEFALRYDGKRGYEGLDFAKETGWDELLKSFAKEPVGRKIARHLITRVGANFFRALFGSLTGPTRKLIRFSEIAGDWEAYLGWRAGKAVNLKLAPNFVAKGLGLPFIGIPAVAATYVGIVGGIATAVEAAGKVLHALVRGKTRVSPKVTFPLADPPRVVDTQKLSDGLFQIGRGVAVAGTNAALTFSQFAPYLNPLGYAVFGIPFAQMFLGIYLAKKAAEKSQQKQGARVLDPTLTSSHWTNGMVRYFGKNHTWD